MHTILMILVISSLSYANQTHTHSDTPSTNLDIPNTRAQVHTLITDTIDSSVVETHELFCDNGELQNLSAQNAHIQNLIVGSLVAGNRKKELDYEEHIFHVRDFFRVGFSGFKGMRTIENVYNTAHSLLRNEIRGWKMLPSTNTSKDNEALYVTDYVPHSLHLDKQITIEAHFIIPKEDAPDDSAEQFVKLGVWIDCIKEESSIQEKTPCLFESDDILIPTKQSFGLSKIITLKAQITIPSHIVVHDNLLCLLLKRTTVSLEKEEFMNKQGIALHMLTLRYPN